MYQQYFYKIESHTAPLASKTNAPSALPTTPLEEASPYNYAWQGDRGAATPKD